MGVKRMVDIAVKITPELEIVEDQEHQLDKLNLFHKAYISIQNIGSLSYTEQGRESCRII